MKRKKENLDLRFSSIEKLRVVMYSNLLTSETNQKLISARRFGNRYFLAFKRGRSFQTYHALIRVK
jgi:hypothetical protein